MQTTTLPSYSASASLFTNNLGQVLFVDQAFLDLMRYSEAGIVTGEPLFRALRLDQQAGRHLLEAIRQGGLLRNHLLEITNAVGDQLRLAAEGVASHDSTGNFLGADISLTILAPDEAARHEAPNEAATLPLASRQVLEEAAFPADNQFLAYYFTTHMTALYVLFQRLIGLMARERLDKIINQTAQKNGWAVQIDHGLITSDLSNVAPEVYRALLQVVIAYGVNMIGARLVGREMDKVDQNVHEGILILARQAGLYHLYQNL